MSEPVHAVYTYGNPFAPMGFGAFTVELGSDGAVVMTHEHHQARRTWKAHATAALWRDLSAALDTSKFPAPSNTSAPPGAASFSLSVTRAGATAEVAGFPSTEYRNVSLLFVRIVSQMSKDAVLGFEDNGETSYVIDVGEG